MANPWDGKVSTGKIDRLYPDQHGCKVRLTGNSPADSVPKDGYFQLELNHPNYNSMYALVLAAAINKRPIKMRTHNTITKRERASVIYVTVDW